LRYSPSISTTSYNFNGFILLISTAGCPAIDQFDDIYSVYKEVWSKQRGFVSPGAVGTDYIGLRSDTEIRIRAFGRVKIRFKIISIICS